MAFGDGSLFPNVVA